MKSWSSLLTPIPPSCMVAPKSNIANIHNSPKFMNPNVESTKARPDDTALSIQRGRPPHEHRELSQLIPLPHGWFATIRMQLCWASRSAKKYGHSGRQRPPSAGSQRYDFARPPLQTPHAPHKGAPNNPPLLTMLTRHRNPHCPQSFPIVLTSRQTLTCGTATSQPHHYSAPTNSCKVTFIIWLARYSTWHASSNSEV